MKRRALMVLVALIVLLPLSGCETLGYYGQAVSGQFYILTHKQDIDRLLEASDTNPTLKQQLQTVQELLGFAATALQLPVADQFNSYVELQKPHVVWNVMAAPEFSVKPLSWCFPIAGCVSYRGYFNEEAALKVRDKLQQQGFDVYVGGVSAYSTLGWFSDPVLSTVIDREPPQLAALLFHELAHQVVYAPGDTEFNESFATAVEQAGVQRWMAATRSDAEEAVWLASSTAAQQRQQEFVSLVQTTVARLDDLYQSGAAPERMRTLKQQHIEQLRAEYQELTKTWGGKSPYEHWFAQPLNNAQLSTVATYNRLVPAFTAILQQCEERLACLYEEAERLSALQPDTRKSVLEALLEQEQ